MKKAIFAASLGTVLAWTTGCPFPFDNPVEQCAPERGCWATPDAEAAWGEPDGGPAAGPDASVARDGGPAAGPDASVARDVGPARPDAGDLWIDPAGAPERFEVCSGFKNPAAVGLDDSDGLFVLGTGEVRGPDDMDVYAAVSTAAGWQSEHLFMAAWGLLVASRGDRPHGFSFGSFYPRRLHFFERAGASWATFDLSPEECTPLLPGGSKLRAIAVGQEVEILQASCGGQLLQGHWDGDRVSKPYVSWQDTGFAATTVHGFGADSRGRLHALVSHADSHELQYLLRTDAGWAAETLRTNFDGTAQLVLDPDGEAAYCWHDQGALAGTYSAQCVRRLEGKWVARNVWMNQKDAILISAAVLDQQHRFHLGVRTYDLHTPSYWIEDGEGWRKVELARSEPAGDEDTISFAGPVIDSQGAAHFVVGHGGPAMYHLRYGP